MPLYTPLPRGGVVVGYEVAEALHAPLDAIIVCKVGHAENPEYAVCAVAEDGDAVCDEARKKRVDEKWLAKEIERKRTEAKRRREAYGDKKFRASGKIAIIVDDGIATGLTMRLAIREARRESPSRVICAAPVASAEACSEIRKDADDIVLLDDPRNFRGAVGAHYDFFPQITDREVVALLHAR